MLYFVAVLEAVGVWWGLFQNLLRSVPGRQREREGRLAGPWPSGLCPLPCTLPRTKTSGSWQPEVGPRPAHSHGHGQAQRYLPEGLRVGFWEKAWTKGCGGWFCVLGFLHQGAESGPLVGLAPAQRTWALHLSTRAALDPCRGMMGEGKPAPPSRSRLHPHRGRPPHPCTPDRRGLGWDGGHTSWPVLPWCHRRKGPLLCHVPMCGVCTLALMCTGGDRWCRWRWAPAVPHHTGNWIGFLRGRRGGRRAPRVLTSREVSVPISQGRPGPAVPNLPVWPTGTPPTWPHLRAGRMGWQVLGPPRPQYELHLCGASLSASPYPHVTSPSRTALRVPTPQWREEPCGRRGQPRLLVY